MLVLDLTWLRVLARGLYDSSLAPLKRASVFLPAAGLFYAFYVGAIVAYAVLATTSPAAAARRSDCTDLGAFRLEAVVTGGGTAPQGAMAISPTS